MSTDEENGSVKKIVECRVGARLVAAREEKGLKSHDIAARLKVPEHYVRAIEEDDYDRLPGLVFARGYVRSYGKLFELDDDELIRWFDNHTGHDGTETSFLHEGEPPPARQRGMPPVVLWVGPVVALFLVGLISYCSWVYQEGPNSFDGGVDEQQDDESFNDVELGYPEEVRALLPTIRQVQEQEQEQEQEQKQVSPEVSVPKNPGRNKVTAKKNSLVHLAVKFAEDCWVQLQDVSGRLLYSDMHRAGSRLELKVPTVVQARFGNVDGVSELLFDGRTVPVGSNNNHRVVNVLLDAG